MLADVKLCYIYKRILQCSPVTVALAHARSNYVGNIIIVVFVCFTALEIWESFRRTQSSYLGTMKGLIIVMNFMIMIISVMMTCLY